MVDMYQGQQLPGKRTKMLKRVGDGKHENVIGGEERWT